MGWDVPSVTGASAISGQASAFVQSQAQKAERPARQPAPSGVQETAEMKRQRLADQISDAMGVKQGNLVIEKDEAAGRYVYKIVDPDSGSVIRQWPDEEWLRLARSFSEAQPGLWVDRTA
jgi:flagellar protein FlaG